MPHFPSASDLKHHIRRIIAVYGLPDFTGPIPSVSLDKVYLILKLYYTHIRAEVNIQTHTFVEITQKQFLSVYIAIFISFLPQMLYTFNYILDRLKEEV